MSFNFKIWGCRGSIACADPEYQLFGGNTSCVEVNVGNKRIILDTGTGIRSLGKEILDKSPNDNEFDIFLSHTHYDHINGFPFFMPIYNKTNKVNVYAGHLKKYNANLKDTLSDQMKAPFFPIGLDMISAQMKYNDFQAGETIKINDEVFIQTAELNHPNGATGYRVNYKNKSIAYITDTEHKIGEIDKNIVNLVQDSDYMIYDATYSDEEYIKFKGWGHSTWQECLRIADAANVKYPIIFHHDPTHDDKYMLDIEKQARKINQRCIVARQGIMIDI